MQGHLKTLRFGLVLLFCFLVGSISAQSVSGNVVDEQGEAVIGATVMEKGTKNATVTDFDGNFTIKLGERKVLVISYIGMVTQEVNVAGKSNVKVVMKEDATTLQDIVVVGYGTMKKTDLTGSVSSIETEKLNAKGASSAIGNLQGSVPGVNITQSSGRAGSGFDIEIRGKSSINSDTKPIFVIDGVVCSDMDFLNPQDIERIDVLKDASSTAIYGSRATAGVVMVTTKSGAGVSKKQAKPSVTYDGYYGVSKVARMPDFMDAQDFYTWRVLKYTSFAEGTTTNSATSGQPAYHIYDMWQHGLLWKTYAPTDPEYDPTARVNGYSRLKYLLQNGPLTDWKDEILQSGIQQNHYLAVSGTVGNDGDVNYHFGVGYNQDKGIYKGDEQTRINFKGSVDAKITKWLTSGFNFNIARQKNEYADDNGIQNAWRMQPFMRVRDDDGNLIEKPGNYVNLGSDSGNQFSDQVNTMILLSNQTKERETWRLLGSFYINIQPIKGLNIKSTFAPSYTQYRQGTFNDENELISDYTADNGGNRAIMQTNRNFGYTWTNQISYNKTFADLHTVDLLALNEIISSNTENIQTTARSVLPGSTWYNLGSGDNSKWAPVSSYSESSMLSYALRANYTFAGKYMATATIRWDGSSKFAKGHKWGSFPSFALAWRASEEAFLKDVDWLNNLKLRVAYGVTGNNTGIGNYDTQQTVSSNAVYYPFGGTTYTGFYPSGIIDENLTWERSHEFNVGLDFGFLGGRINGSVDLYQKTSKDLLFEVTLPLEAGKDGSNLKKMSTNVGKVVNRGIEVSLTTVNIDSKDWRWETTFNFAHNKNEVKEINGLGEDLVADRLFIGQPYKPIYGYEWNGLVTDKMITVPNNTATINAGLEGMIGKQMKSADYYFKAYGWSEGQSIIVDQNNDGKINTDDQRIWKADPTWTGSVTSNLTWKNVDFSFTIYAKQGYHVSSAFISEYMGYGDRGRMRYNMDYYIPAGTLIDFDAIDANGIYVNPVYQEQTRYGKYPFPQSGSGAYDGTGNDKFANAVTNVDASFVKVKNISLGYTFPKSLLSKVGISKLRLYFNITNPFVFTKYKGFDPEWASATLKNDAPSTITYQFGASLKF